MRSVGVEEELLLLDAESGEPRALSTAVLAVAGRRRPQGGGEVFEHELHRQQLEFATRPHTDMRLLDAEIGRLCEEADAHAQRFGARAAAVGTSPLPVSPAVTQGSRYQWLSEEFGITTQEQLTCGCHVHVSVDSDEEGVRVLDGLRPWLAVLLALSANSPFWQGVDTGYSSYRSRVWMRWPSAGPVEAFGSAQAYRSTVEALLATEAIKDERMVYFDARLSARYPTVEIRVADVCLEPSTATTLAALARGLVETEARIREPDASAPPHGVAVLRLAAWRAARSGLRGRLLHPATMRPVPAETAVGLLLAHVRDALDEAGDTDRVRDGVARLLAEGTGADRQREVLRRTGSMREVTRLTMRGA